jgi:carboxylesterase type B
MKILLAVFCLLNVITFISAQEISDAEGIKTLAAVFSPNVKNTTGYEEVDTVEVATLLGTIKGKTVLTDDGTEINTFLGIPYAQPPVGNLRFVPPRPVYGYKDFEAFSFGSSCPQKDELFQESDEIGGDEDCLYLDIYDKVSNQTMLKSVMVWIHGGGFSTGSGSVYNPVSLVKEDVIVVNINYRLGALGFLNFGNDLAPGNLGLRDQIQALKWVKMMSIYFGGDPNRITIFGESAGAISCHALTMSPKAYGLMSGAIYESGTALLSRADLEKTKTHRAAARAAQYFNCSSSNFDANMLKCLQELTLDEIFSITPEITLGEAFFPIMDPFSSDPVNPVDYLTAMKNGQFNRIPIMTGTLKNDGGLFMPADNYEEYWKAAGVDFLGLKSSFDALETTKEENLETKLIKRYYTGESSYLPDTIEEYTNMMTDSLFLSPDQVVA